MLTATQYARIGDFGLIGDCRSAGLVSRDGSLDWLCFPRFDSPSVFGALLDARRGGRFRIQPTGKFQSTRRYLRDTNVLETIFQAAEGSIVVRDLMPVATEEEKRETLTPDHEVLREIQGLQGEVEIEVLYEPRPDYARQVPRLEQRGAFGVWCEASRGGALTLRSDVPICITSDGTSARGFARVRAGDRRFLSLTYGEEAPQVLAPLGEAAMHRAERSIRWWRCSGCWRCRRR